MLSFRALEAANPHERIDLETALEPLQFLRVADGRQMSAALPRLDFGGVPVRVEHRAAVEMSVLRVPLPAVQVVFIGQIFDNLADLRVDRLVIRAIVLKAHAIKERPQISARGMRHDAVHQGRVLERRFGRFAQRGRDSIRAHRAQGFLHDLGSVLRTELIADHAPQMKVVPLIRAHFAAFFQPVLVVLALIGQPLRAQLRTASAVIRGRARKPKRCGIGHGSHEQGARQEVAMMVVHVAKALDVGIERNRRLAVEIVADFMKPNTNAPAANIIPSPKARPHWSRISRVRSATHVGLEFDDLFSVVCGSCPISLRKYSNCASSMA